VRVPRQASGCRCHHLAPPRIRHRSPASSGSDTQARGSASSASLYENRSATSPSWPNVARNRRRRAEREHHRPDRAARTAVSIPTSGAGCAGHAALCADGTTSWKRLHLDRATTAWRPSSVAGRDPRTGPSRPGESSARDLSASSGIDRRTLGCSARGWGSIWVRQCAGGGAGEGLMITEPSWSHGPAPWLLRRRHGSPELAGDPAWS